MSQGVRIVLLGGLIACLSALLPAILPAGPGPSEARSANPPPDYDALVEFPDPGPVARGGPTFRVGPVANEGIALLSGGALDVALGDHWMVGVGAIWADGNLDGTEVFYAGLRGGWFQQLGSWFWLTGRTTVGGGTWLFNPPGPGGDDRNPFVVVEPEVLLGVSVTPSSRIGLGASYRLAVGPEGGAGVDGRFGFSGPTLSLQIEYGKAPAGDDSIFGPPKGEGVYAGISGILSAQVARIGDNWTVMDGGGPRVMFINGWNLGFIGHRGHVVEDDGGNQWRTIYAGALVQKIFAPHRVVHGSLMAVVGAGSTGYVEPGADESIMSFHTATDLIAFAELNLTDYLRLSTGLGLRLGVPLDDRAGLSVADVSSPIGLVQLRFGRF